MSYKISFIVFIKASQEEAIKQKDAFASEVTSLRGELQQVRDDRDRQISQVQTLSTEIVKFKDSSEKFGSELNNLTMKTHELEVGL
jgi:kinesin family protein C1